MKSFQSYLDQINELLDQLIQNAKQLRDVSLQVISEEELTTLQRQQEEILAKLETVDQDIQKHYFSEIKESIHDQIRKKLDEFQALNQDFIANLNATHGLIQFELRHLKEGEEKDNDLLNLNKTSFSKNFLQIEKNEQSDNKNN